MQEKKMKSRMKIELNYSQEKAGILNYIDKLFTEYLLSKELREQQILQTKQRYMEERTFLKQEIENYKEV